MPAPRKPLNELILKGTVRTNKAKYRTRLNQPVPSGPIGDPPDHLTKEERAVWREMVRASVPGVLGNSDRMTLEVGVRLVMKLRTGEMKASELTVLSTVLTKLGMTPADRSKVTANLGQTMEIEAEDDPWRRF